MLENLISEPSSPVGSQRNGEGISREGDVLDLGVARNIVDKLGAWYSYNGERIGQGRDNTRNFLKQNPDVFAAIDKQLRALMAVGSSPESAEPATPIAQAKAKASAAAKVSSFKAVTVADEPVPTPAADESTPVGFVHPLLALS